MAPPTPWSLLSGGAGERYDNEPITQLQHALQCAALAKADGASEALQLAALFHDVGHLMVADAGRATLEGRDLQHERFGARFLSRWYGPEVFEPVALHVLAKRYLARDPDYLAGLSEESRRSLGLQGGPLSDPEAAEFRARGFAADALALRRWDDLAKDPAAHTPGLDTWIGLAASWAHTVMDD